MYEEQQHQRSKSVGRRTRYWIIGSAFIALAIGTIVVFLIQGLEAAISLLVCLVIIGLIASSILGVVLPGSELWTMPIRGDYHRFKAVRKSALWPALISEQEKKKQSGKPTSEEGVKY
ncbi:MAG TPA: hypothetical protein VF043_15930 [Ktedonobacteraceae bacterium]